MEYNKFYALFLILMLIFLYGCYQSTSPSNTEIKEELANINKSNESINVINITSSGFIPDTIKIKKGQAVKFVNVDTNKHWPASDVHPTHNVYPEKGGCIGSKFDACKPLQKDESFIFVFNEIGTWDYHDHLNPGLKGKIIVEG
ncbi:MAG: cupredoxin domain-containing protein [Candidatus Anstonellales archaeon]